jgi:DNA-binding NarL/FixJ family response regulator
MAEVHRAHVMRKLGVHNLIDLLKRAAAMGLVEMSPV